MTCGWLFINCSWTIKMHAGKFIWSETRAACLYHQTGSIFLAPDKFYLILRHFSSSFFFFFKKDLATVVIYYIFYFQKPDKNLCKFFVTGLQECFSFWVVSPGSILLFLPQNRRSLGILKMVKVAITISITKCFNIKINFHFKLKRKNVKWFSFLLLLKL